MTTYVTGDEAIGGGGTAGDADGEHEAGGH